MSRLAEGPSVVVPAAGNPSTVACIRSLGSVGVHTIVVTEKETTQALYSAYCDEAVSVPDPTEDIIAYKEALLDVTSREDVRTIIPVREEDIYTLARYQDEFEEHVSLVTPSLASLRQVHDRIRLFEAAEAAGVPIPETRLLTDVEDWSPELIIKSRYNLLTGTYLESLGPDEIVAVNSMEHARPGEEPDCDAIREEMGHDPIVQEYIRPLAEFMVGALYDHGEPLAMFQHHQIRGTTYVGSGGVYRESTAIPALEAVSRTLLDHLDWHGLACLEYMQDRETGEFKLAEINPRMWQSLAATVRMGADFPRYYWLAATGRTEAIDPGYDVGVGCHWLKGELLYLLSLFRHRSPLVDRPGVLTTLREIASSCYDQPHFDYLSRDDPGPFIQDWWDILTVLPVVDRLRLPGCRPIANASQREGDRQKEDTADPDPEDQSILETSSG